MEIMGMELQRLNHACFKLKAGKKVVYFDPYEIEDVEPADLILISHDHYDHCSPADIMRVATKRTTIVAAEGCMDALRPLDGRVHQIIFTNAGDKTTMQDYVIESVPAYNLDKFKSPGEPFHPKGTERCGFVLEVAGRRIYHAGDTDAIPEMDDLAAIDIALLPVSGTYVMTATEAADAVRRIRPKVAVPMHYGAIVGTARDAKNFWNKAKSLTQVLVL